MDQEDNKLVANSDVGSVPSNTEESTVNRLEDDLETIATTLRKPLPSEPFESEPECARAVELARSVAGDKGENSMESPAGRAVDSSGELGQIGPYQLLKMLGQGGMGAVYKALHPRLDKIVALKVLRTERVQKGALDRFDREMKALGKIDHPHLIRALDAGTADKTHYLVMEFVSGMDLSALMTSRGALRIPDACELIAQAAMGLHAAHSRGMIHRDIKPANLMLAEQEFGPPVVKVLDLGLALLAESAQSDTGGLTSDGQIMGTVDYMPPEQAQDSHLVDVRADIYSLGATLYALLTGGSIFMGRRHSTLMQKLAALATEPIPDVRERRPDASEALAKIVSRMTARHPNDRFATSADVIAALKPFTVGADLSALLTGKPTIRDTDPCGDDATVQLPVTEMHQTVVRSVPKVAPASERAGDTGGKSKTRILIAGAMIGLAVLAAVLFTLKTPNGEVIVSIPDELPAEVKKEIKISVTGDGTAEVASEANGWKVGIKEGKYSVELTGGSDRVQVEDKQVTVSRSKKAIVTITMKPTGAVAAKGMKPTGEANSDAERRAAEWLLSLNEGQANLMVEIVGGQMTDVGNRQLPAVPFHVRHINLEGPIIDQLGDRLADELPAKIGGIRVHGLRIRSRTLTTAGFAKLVAMPELSEASRITLVCVDPGMNDGVLPLLAKLPDLKAVTIVAESGLTGAGIGELRACAELSEIEWQQWQHGSLSATAVEELTQLPKLTTLSFNNITCTERHMMAIAKLKLRQLGFLASKVDDGMLRHLATTEKLETLGIIHNPITDQGLAELKPLKTLKVLNLQGTKVTASGVADLKKALPDCKVDSDVPATSADPATERRLAEWVLGVKGIVTVRKPSGESLEVSSRKDLPKEPFTLTGANLAGLGGNDHADEISNDDCRQFAALSGLETLNLSRQEHVTAEGLAHFSGCRDLKLLGISNSGVGVDAIPLVAKFTKLETFQFPFTQCDTWAEALAKMPTLRKIVAYRTILTDAGVAHLAQLPKLDDLNLVDTDISDASLKSLATCKSLKSLELNGEKLTWPEIKRLQQALPECKIVEWRLIESPDYKFAQWLKSLPPPLTFDVTLTDGSVQRIDHTQPLPLEPLRVQFLFLHGPALDQPGNDFVDEFERQVKGQRITGLQLKSQTLTSERVARLVRLPEFSEVTWLSMSSEVVDDKAIEALGSLQKLAQADLQCPKISGKGLKQLRELTDLAMHGAEGVTGEGLEELAQLPKLTGLQIDGNRFTERHVEALAKLKLRMLIAIDAGIDDAMLARLVQMPTLEKLVLNINPVTDAAVADLKKMKGLLSLELLRTNLTAAGVADLQKALPNCKVEWDGPKQ